jgi:hypothetical protein
LWPRRTALALCLLIGGACGSDDTAKRRTRPVDPNDFGDLDSMALRLEDMVAVGDVDGIASHWLQADELEGCRLGQDELIKAEVETFLADRLSKFRLHATDSLSKKAKGEVLFTFRKKSRAEIMGQRLRGENCPAKKHGQVFVYVKRSELGGIIEHHFNLERAEDAWRVFRYRTERVRCKKPGWADTRICKREARKRRR